MMDKELLHEKLSALLDNELSEQERGEVEALIHSDPGVAREWEELKRIDGLFRSMPRYEAPKELTLRLGAERKARSLSFGRRHLTRRAAWPLLAAAAALVVVFGLVWFQFPQTGVFNTAQLEKTPVSEPLALDKAESKRVPAAEELAERSGDAVLGRAAPPSRRRGKAGSDVPPQENMVEAMPTQPKAEGAMQEQRDAPLSDEDMALGGTFHRETAASTEQEKADVESLPASALIPRSPPMPAPPPAAAKQVPTEGVAREETKPDEQLSFGEDGKLKRIGERVFENRENIWVENTYDNQQTVTLARESDEAKALLAREPALRGILAMDEEVVFELDGVWYRVPELTDSPSIPAESQP